MEVDRFHRAGTAIQKVAESPRSRQSVPVAPHSPALVHLHHHLLDVLDPHAHFLEAARKAILVSSHHNYYYPNQVALLSATNGHKLREYWHSGYLEHVVIADFDGDGQEDICLGGTNNAYNAATLILLDPYAMAGASVEEDPRNQLLGFAPGNEKARLIFPRSCINRWFVPRNHVGLMNLDAGALTIVVVEREKEHATNVFRFDHKLNLIDFQFGDLFKTHHLEFEASRVLDHSLSATEETELKKIRRLR